MTTTVKSESDIKIESFFEGVDEMRAYLDRDKQAPHLRRERLMKVARAMVKARSLEDLALWLLREISAALGISNAVLLGKNEGGNWRLWQKIGIVEHQERVLAAIPHLQAQKIPAPLAVEFGTILLFRGVEEDVAVLWLLGAIDLDEASSAILQAMADTLGVLLEQGLKKTSTSFAWEVDKSSA